METSDKGNGNKMQKLNMYINQVKAFKENDFNDSQSQTIQHVSYTKDYKKKIK